MSTHRPSPLRSTLKFLRVAWELLRWVRPGIGWQAIRYAWWRNRVEARWPRPSVDSPWQTWGRVVRAAPSERGAAFTCERGTLEILVLTADMVRVSWLPGPEPPPYAIARPPETWPAVDITLEEDADGWRLRTPALTVHVHADGRLQVFDAAGRQVREDLPPERNGHHVRLPSRLRPDEHLYGLGERATHANRRGGRYTLWNRDPGNYTWGDDPLYLNIPVYVGLHGQGSYLVFFENPYRATFDLAAQDPNLAVHHFEGGLLRYYLVVGTPPTLLERYTDLTGKPPLPPLWALGYHQSRYSYYPEARVRQLVDTFARYDIPLEVVHLDIHYMHDYRVFTWNRERFPDPKRLASDLRARGVRLIVIVDPGVKVDPRYRVYREGHERGYFCTLPDGTEVHAPVWPGWSAFADFTRPEVRKWWGEQYAVFVETGIAGFWHDMNEPVVFSAWGDRTLPLCTQHALEGQDGDHAAAHNLFGLQMARAAYEGLRRLAPDRRPIIISRSGWAGLQRYAWNWTGDNYSDWASFYLSVPMLIGLGLSGIPFTGPDIGGFQGAPTPELYTRWLQAGVFFPFYRTHTCIGTPDQEPWAFGEPYTRINRETIRLRYRLLAYIYTTAWQAATRGWPPVRPLWWDHPEEARLWDVDDAFLFGDALLVAPVVEEGARWRTVLLPPGLWYDFWTGDVYEGGREITVDAPLDYTPVFVRGGHVVPLLDPAANTDRLSRERITLRVYPPRDAATVTSYLYTDDGDGWAYQEGAYRVDRFRLHREGSQVHLTWESDGAYPWPYREVTCVWQGPERVQEVRVNGTPTPHTHGTCRLPGPGVRVTWVLR